MPSPIKILSSFLFGTQDAFTSARPGQQKAKHGSRVHRRDGQHYLAASCAGECPGGVLDLANIRKVEII